MTGAIIVTASVTRLCYAGGKKISLIEGGKGMVTASSTSAAWLPWAQRKAARSRPGMIMALKPSASRALAEIPGRVVTIGPRFRSGDYLVTLEYARPLTYHNEVIQRIDAFRSELYEVEEQPEPGAGAACNPCDRRWPVAATGLRNPVQRLARIIVVLPRPPGSATTP